MAKNTITIELSKQDRELLQALREAFLAAHPNCERCAQSAITWAQNVIRDAEAEDPKPVETIDPEPEAPAEAEAAPQEAKPEEPEYTTTHVRHMVTKLIAAGKKAQARDIIKSYADCIDNLPTDKLPEIMEKLTAA